MLVYFISRIGFCCLLLFTQATSFSNPLFIHKTGDIHSQPSFSKNSRILRWRKPAIHAVPALHLDARAVGAALGVAVTAGTVGLLGRAIIRGNSPVHVNMADISKKFKGAPIDIYGRVPYDDYLFTNWRLTDPNLLRRSFPEAIADEYPSAIKAHSLRSLAYELRRVMIGIALMGALMYSLSGVYTRAIKNWEADKARLGFNNIPLSAVPRGTQDDGEYDVVDGRFVDHLKDMEKKTSLEIWLEQLVAKLEREVNAGKG